MRCALNLPPANRHPLGRGPTGKDKAKPFVPRDRSVDPSTGMLEEGSQSPQTSSSSPQSTSLTMSSVAPGDTPDLSSWEQSLSLPAEDYLDRDRIHPTAPGTSTAHAASSGFASDSANYRFDYGSQPASRSSLPNTVFLSPNPASFSQSSDRPSASSSTLARDNPFGFGSSATQTGHGSSNALRGLQSPPSGASHPLDGSLGDSMSSQGMTYGLRRSLTEPQNFNAFVDNFSHAPYSQQTQHTLRLSQPSRLPPTQPPTNSRYGGPEGSNEQSRAPRTS